MDSKDASEIEAEYTATFGREDGLAIQRLTNGVSQLCIEWRMFLYFFAGPTERVDTLNAASGLTARMISNTFLDNALSKIRRLTDRYKSGSNKNLSLEALKIIADSHSGVDLSSEYDAMMEVVQPARKYADKYLAHYDFHHALGDKKLTLRLKEITEAIRALKEFTRIFHLKVRETDYVLMPITTAKDEQRFLLCLHLGVQSDAANAAALSEGVRKGDVREFKRSDIPSWIADPLFRDDPF